MFQVDFLPIFWGSGVGVLINHWIIHFLQYRITFRRKIQWIIAIQYFNLQIFLREESLRISPWK